MNEEKSSTKAQKRDKRVPADRILQALKKQQIKAAAKKLRQEKNKGKSKRQRRKEEECQRAAVCSLHY